MSIAEIGQESFQDISTKKQLEVAINSFRAIQNELEVRHKAL